METQDIVSSSVLPLAILLADDDTDDHHFFSKVLETVPYHSDLIILGDGEKLMNYLFQNTHNLPDVLFLDHNMPRKNGAECLIEIKAHPLLKKLPVIMYSTYLHEDIADELYANGAHFYLRKTDLAELKKSLHEVLQMLVEKTFVRPSRTLFVLSPIEL
ncbi:MAG: rcp1 2 [Chitinophagaceae bacterium]|nr:rcp1 2 [Chitinophagaceae bacterium]